MDRINRRNSSVRPGPNIWPKKLEFFKLLPLAKWARLLGFSAFSVVANRHSCRRGLTLIAVGFIIAAADRKIMLGAKLGDPLASPPLLFITARHVFEIAVVTFCASFVIRAAAVSFI